MSKSEIQRLHQDALQDLALQERLNQAQNNENLLDLVMELGQEKGYSFTMQEAEEYISEVNSSDSQRELSQEQLEAISGGLEEQLDDNGNCYCADE